MKSQNDARHNVVKMTGSFRALLNKLSAYRKAYSGHILWPLMLPLRELQLKHVARMASEFIDGGMVLDVGTGYGFLPIEIAERRPRAQIVGIDIQSQLISDGINYALKKGVQERVSLIRAEAESLPFADGTFDVVLSTMSLHLWRDQRRGISEIQRVLKTGGRVQILVGGYYLSRGLARITDGFTKRSVSKLAGLLAVAAFEEWQIDYISGLLKLRATK
jgi:ubiquinone/menaquinone biosynthesis C-methylase UbiE